MWFEESSLEKHTIERAAEMDFSAASDFDASRAASGGDSETWPDG